jgi:hypothetical protein
MIVEKVSVFYSVIEFGGKCIPMMNSMRCSEKAIIFLDVRFATMCSVITSLIQGGARIDGIYFDCTKLESSHELWDAIGRSQINVVGIYRDERTDHQHLALAAAKMANLDTLTLGLETDGRLHDAPIESMAACFHRVTTLSLNNLTATRHFQRACQRLLSLFRLKRSLHHCSTFKSRGTL